MRHRTTQILYGYWNEVRRGQLAPRRFDIEPARIAGILAETLILERVDAEAYRFRLAGTRICEQFGVEFRGSNFLELWTKGDRARLTEMLAQLVEYGGAGVLEFEGETSDRRTVVFEAILLPLFHTQQTVDRFLGAISCQDSPVWLGSVPIVRLALISHDIVWPEGRPHALVEKMNRRSPFIEDHSQARVVRMERRHFRVLEGGRRDGDRGEQ